MDKFEQVWILDIQDLYLYEDANELSTKQTSIRIRTNGTVDDRYREKPITLLTNAALSIKNRTDNEKLLYPALTSKPPKCRGIYCDYVKSVLALPPDEKDELNNIYVRSTHQLMETDPSKRFLIEYKSVVIDVVEKAKTLQRIAESMQLDLANDDLFDETKNASRVLQAPKQEERKRVLRLDAKAIQELPEGLLYKLRKCKPASPDYSIPDVKKSRLMKHFSFANLYEKVPVCCYCKAMYDKIDFLRVNADNSTNPFLANPKLIPAEVSRYLSDRDRRDRNQLNPERKIFSNAFYEDLEHFDLPVKLDPEFKLEKDLMTSFYRDLEERRERDQRAEQQQILRQSESVASFVAKKVKDVTLKMHVGSREPVRGSELGAITSSSSLKLSRIQTVAPTHPENEGT